MKITDTLSTGIVPLSDRFIKEYMPQASGDYVKVYLWLLSPQNADRGAADAAGELMLTEKDVERALRYWQDKGVINITQQKNEKPQEEPLRSRYSSAGAAVIFRKLEHDREFTQLKVIAGAYLPERINPGKMLETLAYLYDGLGLCGDVIDYLIEYAVEHDKANLRYIETTGEDWAANGVSDVASARRYVESRITRAFHPGKKQTAHAPAEPPRAVTLKPVTVKPVSVRPALRPAAGAGTSYEDLLMQELAEKLVD